ncbi:hypothetical protein NDU88_005416 [Pleurodeles waltl]|uniref:Uncharacterized protein n=1 Tax=Pleurodeles waltl TaxID=8319 RepID=A0AAV7SLP0_PLEWA|nr:hypothetical protein NDU88_005416 [Pleurodeles waltl]
MADGQLLAAGDGDSSSAGARDEAPRDGEPVLLSTRSGRGGQPAGSQVAGSGTQKNALSRLNTDGGRAASRGQEPAITAPPRLGQETRLRESGDLVQCLSHPAERGSPPRDQRRRKVPSAASARRQSDCGDRRGAGDLDDNRSSVLARRAPWHPPNPQNPVRVGKV